MCSRSCRSGRPAKCASLRPQHPLKPSRHFLFFDEFTTIGLSDAIAHGGTESSIFLKYSQCSLLHESLGIRAGLHSYLR